MQAFPLFVFTLLVAAAVPLAAGSTDSVTLQVTLGHHALPAAKECALAIPTPTDGAAVLEAAIAAGCISSYETASFPGFGRYVTCIDGLCEQTGTFWGYYVNEAFSDGGIDDTNGAATIHAGDVVEFVYSDWFSGALLP